MVHVAAAGWLRDLAVEELELELDWQLQANMDHAMSIT